MKAVCGREGEDLSDPSTCVNLGNKVSSDLHSSEEAVFWVSVSGSISRDQLEVERTELLIGSAAGRPVAEILWL